MNIIYLIILLLIIFLGIGLFVKKEEIKIYYWKKKFLSSNVKTIIEEVFKKNFVFYKHLDEEYKNKLLTDTYIISKLKNIEGINIKISDEIRYTVFGLSGLLLLGDKNTNYYKNLTTIIIYPRMYISEGKSRNESINLGESWNFGVVILSWADVYNDAMNFSDGHNVVLHEFAHQLDQQDGTADGIPSYLNVDYYKWKKIFDKEYNNLVDKMKNAESDSIDFYGTINKAEFFAVLTEEFFEKPIQLKNEHKDLYDLLVEYYKIDPIKIFR